MTKLNNNHFTNMKHILLTSKKSFIFIGIAGVFLAVKIFIYANYPVNFYEYRDDYVQHSLSHAINIDSWLSAPPAKRTTGFFQTTHPGIPFQLSSAIVYKIANLTVSQADNYLDRAISTLLAPQTFFAYNQVAAYLLFLFSLWLLYTQGERFSILCGVLLLVIYLSYFPVLTYGMGYLGNETFSLLLFLGLSFCVTNLFRSPNSVFWGLWTGVMSGLSYLNKLNYITWSVAVFVSVIAFGILSHLYWMRIVKMCAVYISGVTLSILCIGGIFLGLSGIREMVLTHLRFISRTGHYGGGDAGIVKLSLAQAAFVSFIREFPLSAVGITLIFLVTAYILRRNYKEIASNPGFISSLIFFIAVFAGAFLAAMKHYWPYYVVPAFVALPLLVLLIWPYLNKPLRYALTGFFCFAALINIYQHINLSKSTYQQIGEYNSEVAEIRSLPILEGEFRIWHYKIMAKEYLSFFITEMSGISEIHEMLKNSLPQDISIFRGIPEEQVWRYAIYPKHYFPAFTDIPQEIQDISQPVFNGSYLLVVEIKN